MWPAAQQTLSLTHTHTQRLQSVFTHHVCSVFSCTEEVQLQLPAARWQSTLWSEIIWHTSLRAPCVAAPAEAWTEILPADWWLRPLVSMGLIINCHGLQQACGRPAFVGERESRCRKWQHSEIKHTCISNWKHSNCHLSSNRMVDFVYFLFLSGSRAPLLARVRVKG